MADHVKISAGVGSVELGGGGEWSFRVAGPHVHCVSIYAQCVYVCGGGGEEERM